MPLTKPLPALSVSDDLDSRLTLLDGQLKKLGSVLVAFSGGADSAFLLAAAVRALGADRVTAATAVSASLPTAELDAASSFAHSMGVRHLTPATQEIRRFGYAANGTDRCFHCKAELLDVLTDELLHVAAAAVATGTNADDVVAGFRPGIQAAALRGAVTPLADAGLTKAQIRQVSKQWGLITHDKPAAACLSSRIAYGISITPIRLARIEQAELSLRSALREAQLSVRNLRVRDLGGGHARIEVDLEFVSAVSAQPGLLKPLRELFTRIDIDPRGFRSGSLNESDARG